jgi:terminase small subunit / prophage DNA-packing protein
VAETRGKSANRSELGRIWGVSPTTIDAWLNRGCPYVSSPREGARGWTFDTAAVAEWREEQAARGAVGNVEGLDLDQARLRKTAAEAALAEYELAEKRAQIVTVEDAARIVGEHNARVRSRILALPGKVAPFVAVAETAEECRDLLDGAVHEVLAELAAGSDDDHDGDEDRIGAGGAARAAPGDADGEQPDAEAAAEAPGKRVGRRAKAAQPRGQRGTREVGDLPG